MDLLEFPSELLLHIASFLPQVDLLNVSLTNKALRHVTEPELHRDYINANTVNRKRQKESLRSFVGHLLDRPHVAKHVRRVELATFSHLDDLVERSRGCIITPVILGPMECARDEYERFAQAAKVANIITTVVPYTEAYRLGKVIITTQFGYHSYFGDGPHRAGHQNWFNHYLKDENVAYDTQFCILLQLGLDDALIILLMALLHNIRDLELGNTSYNSLPWRVGHQFKSLRSFRVSRCDSRTIWPDWFSNTVLCGGRLELFTIHAWEGQGYGRRGPNFAFRANAALPLSFRFQSLPINHMRLWGCRLTGHEMQMVLQACPSLKAFGFLSPSKRRDANEITVADLIHSLHSHKASLEELEVDGDNSLALPSMRDFTALKCFVSRVCMWGDAIFPSENNQETTLTTQGSNNGSLKPPTQRICFCLPPSLETIKILEGYEDCNRSIEQWEFDQLKDLISHQLEILPKLKTIHYVEYEVGSALLSNQAFRKMAADVGCINNDLDFTIISHFEHSRQRWNNDIDYYPETRQRINLTEWTGEKYVCKHPNWKPKAKLRTIYGRE